MWVLFTVSNDTPPSKDTQEWRVSTLPFFLFLSASAKIQIKLLFKWKKIKRRSWCSAEQSQISRDASFVPLSSIDHTVHLHSVRSTALTACSFMFLKQILKKDDFDATLSLLDCMKPRRAFETRWENWTETFSVQLNCWQLLRVMLDSRKTLVELDLWSLKGEVLVFGNT